MFTWTYLDRYLLRSIAKDYLSIAAIVLFILVVEHISRLLTLAKHVGRPAALISDSLLNLLPEYAGLGLVVALFLSITLTFRRLALSSELDIWSSCGVSDLRLLRVPLIVGCITALLVLSIRFYVQPIGENNLIAIGERARVGEYGLGFSAGEIARPGKQAIITFDRIDSRSHRLTGVFVHLGDRMFTAESGTAHYDRDRRLVLVLRNGTFMRFSHKHTERARFGLLLVTLPTDAPEATKENRQDRLDRRTLPELVEMVRCEAASLKCDEAGMARAALLARLNMGNFCLLLPLFGFVLGLPSKRGRTAVGVGAGILIIVGFLRTSAGIEDNFPDRALLANGILVLFWTALCGFLFHLDARYGHGFLESVADRNVRFWSKVIRDHVRPRRRRS